MHSPLSSLPGQKVRDLPRGFLLTQLADYFHSTPPAEVVETDYSLWRCSETGLEFCDPPRPGNAAFYEWVSSFSSYYPGFRWEYGEVSRLLQNEKLCDANFKILDVGCGEGDFLRALNFIPAERKCAVDLNEPAIRACLAQGFKAYRGTLETAIADGFFADGEFPVVTSFHCLEHVAAPVEFVRSLLRATAPGGRLFLSTPYSPMSFENDWFDVMNHPPHHMTRWTLDAYRCLAAKLGAKMRFFAPRCRPAKQALQAFQLRAYGPNTSVAFPTQVRDILSHLPAFLSGSRELSNRAAKHDIGGADVILVELMML